MKMELWSLGVILIPVVTAAVCRSSSEATCASRPLLTFPPLFWTMDSWEPGAYPEDHDDDSRRGGPSGVLEQLRKLDRTQGNDSAYFRTCNEHYAQRQLRKEMPTSPQALGKKAMASRCVITGFWLSADHASALELILPGLQEALEEPFQDPHVPLESPQGSSFRGTRGAPKNLQGIPIMPVNIQVILCPF